MVLHPTLVGHVGTARTGCGVIARGTSSGIAGMLSMQTFLVKCGAGLGGNSRPAACPCVHHRALTCPQGTGKRRRAVSPRLEQQAAPFPGQLRTVSAAAETRPQRRKRAQLCVAGVRRCLRCKYVHCRPDCSMWLQCLPGMLLLHIACTGTQDVAMLSH